jgi:DNA repair exonuclease SbcCD nuclease subunit
MRALHTADIHLREYGDERWNVLSNLVDIGKKENIDIFAISGDLFDKETNAENLRSKIREVFSGNGYKVIMIPGNHDESAYKDMYFGEDAFVLTDCEKPFQFEGARGLDAENVEGILHNIQRFDEEYRKKTENLQKTRAKKESIETNVVEIRDSKIPDTERKTNDSKKEIDRLKAKTREESLKDYAEKLKQKKA